VEREVIFQDALVYKSNLVNNTFHSSRHTLHGIKLLFAKSVHL
jgi:hypothetical protein